MKLRWLLLAGAAAAALSSPAEAGAACTCMSPKRPACEVWWQTSAIFVGRVTSIRAITENTSDGKRVSRLVTLRVQERWRGVEGDRDVVVQTGAGASDCGFDFAQNQNYLIYGNPSTTTGRLETGICSRTAPVEDAEVDLAYLRSIATAEKIVSMYGMVYRERQQLQMGQEIPEDFDRGGPLPGIEITIEELGSDGLPITGTDTATPVDSSAATPPAASSLSLVTDEEGWYEFDSLHPGRYEIRLDGAGIAADSRWRMRIPLGPACIWRNIIVPPLPRGERISQQRQD